MASCMRAAFQECVLLYSYKRVKGRSHPAEKRISILQHKPHATSQPSRLSHTRMCTTLSFHASSCGFNLAQFCNYKAGYLHGLSASVCRWPLRRCCFTVRVRGADIDRSASMEGQSGWPACAGYQGSGHRHSGSEMPRWRDRMIPWHKVLGTQEQRQPEANPESANQHHQQFKQTLIATSTNPTKPPHQMQRRHFFNKAFLHENPTGRHPT